MLTDAISANATPLPVERMRSECVPLHDFVQAPDLPAWAASIGRTAADVAALMFRLPMPAHLRPLFEDTIRQEVAAELLALTALLAHEREHLEDIAWLAFDRRLSLHTVNLPLGGEA